MKINYILAGSLCLSLLAACNSSTDEAANTTPTSLTVLPKDTTGIINASATNTTTNQTTTNLQAPVISSGTQALNPEHGKPGHRCDIAVGAPLTSTPANTSITPAVTTQPSQPIITPAATPVTTNNNSAGINPAHGQPGHRCDIAVGAPLNSKPTTQPSTVVQQLPLVPSDSLKPAPIITPAAPTKTDAPATMATAPGMNPPHGQPGHRCEIAVGAPLNSAPKKN